MKIEPLNSFFGKDQKRVSVFTLGVKRVVIGLISLVIVSTVTAQKEEEMAESPPSLEEIIQNVRARTEPLDKAVVRIAPYSGAGDGGGRLYWKSGLFVRSKSYRIGYDGQVDVYDTVSNQNATSFLFHTIKKSGPSFSFSLRMPYDSASTTGYGLSDYFLLEHVANHRFDVKYGGRLMSLQLFPQQLRTFGDRYEISYVERNNKRYIRLRRGKTMIKTFYFTESIYINPSTWQFEQLVFEDNRRWHRLKATSYQEVNGVRLPEHVRIVSPQFDRPLPYKLEYTVRHGDQLDTEPEPPNWLNDPGVPEVSKLSTRKIHDRLKKEVTADLYKQLMQSAIRYRHMLFRSHFHPKKFQTSVKLARRKHPNAPLLKAYVDGVGSATKVSEDQMYITSFPSIKTNVVLPYMNYAAAYRSMVAGYHEKMKAYLKPVRNKYPYSRIASRLDVLSTLQQIDRSEDFQALLENVIEGASIQDTKQLIPSFIRKVRKNKKWVRGIKDVLKRNSHPFLHLLLVRFYQDKKQYAKANQYVGPISDRRSVQSEMIAYVRRAGFRAEKLVETFRKEITYTSLLMRLSLKRFQNGQPERGITLLERIRSLLKNGESHVLGSMTIGNQSVDQSMSVLMSLFKRLDRNDRPDLVLDLFHHLIKLYQLPWDQDKFVNTLKQVCKGQTNKMFEIAANYVLVGRTDLVSSFLSPDRFREIMMDSVQGNQPADWKFIVLSKSITSGFLKDDTSLRKSRSFLKEGLARFPEDGRNGPFILNGLGDAHFRLEEYEKASDTYQTLLDRVRRTKHPKYFPDMFRSVSGERVASVYKGSEYSIDTTDPVIVKLASALDQSSTTRKKREQAIWPYVRLYSTGTSPAMAFLVYGEKEGALRHLLFRFRQTKNKQVGKELMEALVDIFKSEERLAEAALIFNMAIREKKIENREIRDRYQRIKNKIRQEQLIQELRELNYGTPSKKAKAAVSQVIRRMKQAENKKQRMKYVSKLLNSRANVVPVLLTKLESYSPDVQTLVRKILETVRMRQIYRKLFDMKRGRSPGDTSGSEKGK